VKLTVLGCAGTFPNADSACSSYLVEHQGFRLVLDLGNGALGALQRYAGLLAPSAIFVSHLHADHCADLVAYSYARRFHPQDLPPLPVYAPAGIEQRLADIAGGDTSAFEGVYDFTTVTEGKLEIGPFDVTLARTAHPIECFASRLEADGAVVVYTGDTGPADALTPLAKDADLLLCEASWQHGPVYPSDLHMTALQAGELAARAGVPVLVLTHTTPFTDAQLLSVEAGAVYGGHVVVATPGAVYEL
jgi:ribonuclease BN (tRNA processing enzyme)